MSAPRVDINAEISSAMNSSNPNDIISGVKGVVARELESLSSGARIEYTNYFNHSYMPDIVVSWGSGKKADKRPVFIRNDLNLGSTLGDVENLGRQSPVLLGLTQEDSESEGELEEVRSRARSSARVLVTRVGTIDRFSATSTTNHEPGPLVTLVKDNVLRAGRGLITDADVARLSDSAAAVSTPDQDFEANLAAFSSVATEVFAADGVAQLARAGRLIQASVSNESLQGFLAIADGQLSESEIKIVLPYLMREGGPDSDAFWSAVGSMLSLHALEALTDLHGQDISRLMTASTLRTWEAKLAGLVLNNEYDEEADSGRTAWSFEGGVLTAKIGPYKLLISSGNSEAKLSGRDDSFDANWEELEPFVAHYLLEAASLRGITRSFEVSAERSGNVSADVRRIVETLDDTYRVQQMRVRVLGSDFRIPIRVDFKKMLASALGGRVSVGDLATVTLQLLGHRIPVDADWVVA